MESIAGPGIRPRIGSWAACQLRASVGPDGNRATRAARQGRRFEGSFGEEQSVQSGYPSQLILPGPVVYADRLYDELIQDGERIRCRPDSGCFRHQVRGNRPVTARYPPEGWFLINSQSGISSSNEIFDSNLSLILPTIHKTKVVGGTGLEPVASCL